MERESKETDRFLTHDPEGNPYMIVELTEYLHVRTLSGSERVEGHKSYITTDGRSVNRLEELGTEYDFEIVDRPKVLLKREDL
jgi:hypothetical protein